MWSSRRRNLKKSRIGLESQEENNIRSPIIELHSHIAQIAPAEWDACAASDNPFVSHAFLAALEDSGSTGADTGWLPHHLAWRDGAGVLQAVAPAYIKTHSYGEYVFDHAWAEAMQRAGGSYYPKLQIAVPFSPVPGPRLLRRAGDGVDSAAMADDITQSCLALGLSSAHITFCIADEWDALGAAGWHRRLGMQFHWHNNGYRQFDDFLATLSANHRKNIRRERRDANGCGLTFRILCGADIKAHHWDAFYAFYQATVDRKWGAAYLTRDFFTLLGDRLGQQVVLMLAEQDGSPVAGALNLASGDTLYGRNWGCVGSFPFLHFELCYYRAIDFAIDYGLKRVEAGAQGEHKIQRGYLPQPTYSAHWLAHPGLSRAVGDFLDRERPAIHAHMQALTALSPFKKSL